jgi:hypothetical protein
MSADSQIVESVEDRRRVCIRIIILIRNRFPKDSKIGKRLLFKLSLRDRTKGKLISLQTNCRYFPIGLQPEENQTMTDVLIQELLDKAEARMEEAQKRQYEIHDKKIPQELTPWLRRTGWVQRFDNMDMKILHELLEPPKSNPQNPGDKLPLVWNSIARVIEKCWTGVRDVESRNWRLILYWLNSAEEDIQSQSPFRVHIV